MMTAWWSATIRWLLTSGIRVVLILLATYIIIRVVKILIERLKNFLLEGQEDAERLKRAETITHIIRAVAVIFVSAVASMLVLSELGVDLKPILTAAGIGGLAIGFGAQSLVKDVISGFFILLENQIRVGDVVLLGETGGLVEQVNLRTIVLRDLAGNVHIIPNGNITMVTNMTKDYSRYVIDLGVSYREDVDEVIQIIKDIDEEMRSDEAYAADILQPAEILGVDAFEDSQVVIKFRLTTKPIQQWRVGREFRRRIKKVFDEKNIEIPFPHRTIYMGDPKYKEPQPMIVQVETPKNGRTGSEKSEKGPSPERAMDVSDASLTETH